MLKRTAKATGHRHQRMALVATLVGTALTILEIQPSKAAEPTNLKTLVVLPFEIQDTRGVGR